MSELACLILGFGQTYIRSGDIEAKTSVRSELFQKSMGERTPISLLTVALYAGCADKIIVYKTSLTAIVEFDGGWYYRRV